MRASLALLLVLAMALMSGCGASEPKQAVQTGTTEQAAEQPADKPAQKVAEPVTITPDPGPDATKDPATESTIDASDGVDKQEAGVVGGYYLRALRQERLGDAYGTTAEAYTLLNQVKVMKEWLLTYSRTTVDGQPADAYAATIVVDTSTGKQTRVTEAP